MLPNNPLNFSPGPGQGKPLAVDQAAPPPDPKQFILDTIQNAQHKLAARDAVAVLSLLEPHQDLLRQPSVLDPVDRLRGLTTLLYAYQALGRHSQSERCGDAIQQLSGDCVFGFIIQLKTAFRQARTYCRQGRPALGQQILEDAIDEMKEQGFALHQLSPIWKLRMALAEEYGGSAEALNILYAWQRWLLANQKPETSWARASLDSALYGAALYERTGQEARALSLLNSAVCIAGFCPQKLPENMSTAAFALARIYCQLGEFKQALSEYQTIRWGTDAAYTTAAWNTEANVLEALCLYVADPKRREPAQAHTVGQSQTAQFAHTAQTSYSLDSAVPVLRALQEHLAAHDKFEQAAVVRTFITSLSSAAAVKSAIP